MPIPSAQQFRFSGQRGGRSAPLVAAEKRNPGPGFSLRRASRGNGDFPTERLPVFRLPARRLHGARAGREAGALFRNGRKAPRLAVEPSHPAHRAVVFAMPAAADGKIRLAIRGKQRRHQHPAENHHQRKCDGAAHSHAKCIA